MSLNDVDYANKRLSKRFTQNERVVASIHFHFFPPLFFSLRISMRGFLIIAELLVFMSEFEKNKDVDFVNGLFFVHFGLSCAKFVCLSL